MRRRTITLIAGGVAAALVAVGGVTLALLSGADRRDSGVPPYFTASQLPAFLLTQEELVEATGWPIVVRPSTNVYTAQGYDLDQPECSAVLGHIETYPAGARTIDDAPIGSFQQAAVMFAPSERAATRFDEILAAFETCTMIPLSDEVLDGRSSSYARLDETTTAEEGDVRSVSGAVSWAFGFDGASSITIVAHAANVITAVTLFADHGSELDSGPSSREAVQRILLTRAQAALDAWKADGTVDSAPAQSAVPPVPSRPSLRAESSPRWIVGRIRPIRGDTATRGCQPT